MEKIIQWQEDSGMKSDLGPLIAIEGEEELIWFEQIGQFDGGGKIDDIDDVRANDYRQK